MEEKLNRIEDKVDYNRKLEEIKSNYRRRNLLLSISIIPLVLVSGIMGFAIADIIHPGPDMIVPDHNYSIDDHEVAFHIQGKNVILQDERHPDMYRRVGYYDPTNSLIGEDTIYLQEARASIYHFYTTCVHEELHMYGVPGDEDSHEYIAQVEDDIVSPLCLQTVYEYGKYKGGQQAQ